MLKLRSFTFNPFQENTYVLHDDNGDAVIIDPGNSTQNEHDELLDYIKTNGLALKRLILTHAHIDHIMGNKFIHDKFGLLPEVHEEELFFIKRMTESGKLYGVPCEQSPQPVSFLKEGDVFHVGSHEFRAIHTPGHSPGSLSWFDQKARIVMSGDVLFAGSIGRSDLPMGDHDTLMRSISGKLFTLGDDVKVYPGHGPSTTIGHERLHNPFFT